MRKLLFLTKNPIFESQSQNLANNTKPSVWTPAKIFEIATALDLCPQHLPTGCSPLSGSDPEEMIMSISPVNFVKKTAFDSFRKMLEQDGVKTFVRHEGRLDIACPTQHVVSIPSVSKGSTTVFDLSEILLEAKLNGLEVDVSDILNGGIEVIKNWTDAAQVIPFARFEEELVKAKIKYGKRNKFLRPGDRNESCVIDIKCFPATLVNNPNVLKQQ